MSRFLTRSRRTDLLACGLLAAIIALASLRLAVYYKVEERMIRPRRAVPVEPAPAPDREAPALRGARE